MYGDNDNIGFGQDAMTTPMYEGTGCPNVQQPIGCGCPIVEPPMEKVVQRCMMHEVPHICPINTRIINRHIYRHTYQPRYTCCEENQIVNLDQGSCCQFY
ncbi:MAG: CotD family spore coat protein [Bacilli bacterium]